MGENDNDTYTNINRVNYDFDDESFTDISDEAKDFISKLLLKDKEWDDERRNEVIQRAIVLVNGFRLINVCLIRGWLVGRGRWQLQPMKNQLRRRSPRKNFVVSSSDDVGRWKLSLTDCSWMKMSSLLVLESGECPVGPSTDGNDTLNPFRLSSIQLFTFQRDCLFPKALCFFLFLSFFHTHTRTHTHARIFIRLRIKFDTMVLVFSTDRTN